MLQAIFGALLLGLGAYLINKMKTNTALKNTKKNLENKTISREELIAAISYYTVVKKDVIECKPYIEFAKHNYPNDKEIEMVIFKHFFATDDFDSAIHLLEHLEKGKHEDADVLFALALCYKKKNEHIKATEYRNRAIEIDKSFANRNF